MNGRGQTKASYLSGSIDARTGEKKSNRRGGEKIILFPKYGEKFYKATIKLTKQGLIQGRKKVKERDAKRLKGKLLRKKIAYSLKERGWLFLKENCREGAEK